MLDTIMQCANCAQLPEMEPQRYPFEGPTGQP